MAHPEPQPLSPAQIVEQALAVIRADRVCFLATADGDQPRLRPISPVKTDGFTVYVVNLLSHNKTREIGHNPRVELCYLDEHHRQVRITGIAEVADDPALLGQVLGERTLLRAFLEATDRSQFVLYCVRPTLVRFMRGWVTDYQVVPLG